MAQTPLHEPLAVVASVANSYAQRYDSLASGARQMLVLLVASDAGDISALVRPALALGLDVDDLASCEAAGLVDVRDARVEWRHPLVRSAVYGRAAPGERRAAHRAVADSLPDADDDRRAWHLALAALGPDAAASSALEQAGIRARGRSAYHVASRAFERAASLAPDDERRGRLLFSAADAAWLSGLGDRADELLDEAEGHEPEVGLRISIEHLRGHIATRRGRVREGRRILLVAADDAATVDPPRAVVMLADAVHASFYLGDAAAMRRIAEQISALATACVDSRSQFFAAMAEGMALVFSGEGDRGTPLIRRAVAALTRSDEFQTTQPSSRGRQWHRCGFAKRPKARRSSIVRSPSPGVGRRRACCRGSSCTSPSIAGQVIAGRRPRRRSTRPSAWPARAGRTLNWPCRWLGFPGLRRARARRTVVGLT